MSRRYAGGRGLLALRLTAYAGFQGRIAARVEWVSIILGAVDNRAYRAGQEQLAKVEPQLLAQIVHDTPLTLSGAFEYAASRHLPGLVLADLDAAVQRTLGIGAVPTVIVLDSGGLVTARHVLGVSKQPGTAGQFEEAFLEEILFEPD